MSEARVRRLYDEVVAWTNRAENRDFMLARPSGKLQAFARGEAVGLGAVVTALGFLSSWHSASAVAGLLRGDQAAHEALRQAHRYSFWSLLLNRDAFLSDSRPRKQSRLSPNDLALHAARAVALGLLDDGRQLGKLLTGEGASGLLHRSGSQVAPFIEGMMLEWDGSGPRSNRGLREPYRALLANVNNRESDLLTEWLLAACELHLARAHEHTDEETFEFADPVYAIFPVEILMYIRLRDLRGLKTPLKPHPLLTMPLGRLVDLTPQPDEPLLAAVVLRLTAQQS